MSRDRELLLTLYHAAVEAAAPGRALAAALAGATEPLPERAWVLALGKAALPLAREAVAQLAAVGGEPAGGLVVALEDAEPPHPSLPVLRGDHPVPGENSVAAAEAVERLVRDVRPGDTALVLLSGGTSSLIGAPVRGISLDDLRTIHELLLGSGLDIADMNRVRKRFSRWGAGRLARALAHARARVFIVSDVIGDDVAAIASGPCSPDPARAEHVISLLLEADLFDALPPAARTLLERTQRGTMPETPKPDDPAFRGVEIAIIANQRIALDAAAARARALGLDAHIRNRPMRGEAATWGARLAARLATEPLAVAEDGMTESARCFLAGGETTVTLEGEAGRGGRCQELALAAAQRLDGCGRRITLLAAGTDGRDGPTDAAGAIVDEDTWQHIRDAGRDPAADLAAHDAGSALDAIDALLRTGPTGTNVMDLVIAIVRSG